MDERQAERIYAAGFLDGEGCFAVQRTKRVYDPFAYYQPIITVAQIQRAPLDLLAGLFGGIVRPRMLRSNGRVYYFWNAYGKRAVAVIEALQPYLRVKHRQAALLLELSHLTGRQGRWIDPVVYARRQAIWVEVRQLNAGNSARRAERLSELAPQVEGDAIVRTHGKKNRESAAEMSAPLRIVS
jgi:hypothetical protein